MFIFTKNIIYFTFLLFFEKFHFHIKKIPNLREHARQHTVLRNTVRSIKRRVKSEIIIPHEIKSHAHMKNRKQHKQQTAAQQSAVLLLSLSHLVI